METKESVLQRVFGYSAFRGGQEALIDAQLRGQDAFGIMPTGGGKSLCYQIPALLLEGVTLVISPLISLMRDQVMALKNAGVAAAYINSSLTPAQIRLVYRNIRSGMYKIIYVAPERLLTDGFLEAIQTRKVSLVTVDEAHCISQWGQDFRPSYLKIVDFLNILTPRPVVSAFTATATEAVRQDIAQILQLRDPLRVVTGFDRPNLRFEVRRPKQKLPALIELVQQRRDKAGIVYCATRKAVEEVCENLQLNGIAATRYHAGLPDEERRDNQEDFLYDRKTVMVATNAFGMGIDKSNVSYVIHYNMPQSLESYYQEAGRAGRDGAKAECILLYAPGDVQTAKYLIQHPALSGELSQEELEQKQRQDLERLDVMVNYCKTQSCLRGYILDYFGQEHESFCGNCSNCSTETEERDITDQARMILSCVQRMSAKLGYSLGLTSVVRTLLGSRDKRLLQLGLDKLGSYGMLRKLGKDDLRAMAENLESQGYLETDPVHGGVSLTQKAQGVLFEGKTVSMRLPKAEASAPVSSPVGGEQSPDLLAMLKRLRWKIAMQESVPAYIIFSNATLEDMARKAPTTLEAFAKVNGVGSVKVKRFGEVFVDAIADYLQEHGG
uniref:DNA helicase RecQ n=1 Tax=Faecousia sp. TaxID=2952921 RepID=UPI0040278CFB